MDEYLSDYMTSYDTEEECKNNTRYYEKDSGLKTIVPVISNINEFNMLDFNILENENSNNDFKEFEYIRDRINLDIYNYNYLDSIKNTCEYIFYKIGSGAIISIKDNKVKFFVSLNNMNYKNKWSEDIKLPKEFNTTRDYFNEKNKEHRLRPNAVSQYDKSKWNLNGCLVSTEEYSTPDVNTQYYMQLLDMIKETLENRTVPDTTFILNRRDLPILKNDRTEVYDFIYRNKQLDFNKYYYFIPILSQSTTNNHADIPIPTSDDWEYITQKYFQEGCKDKKHKNNIKVEWKDKINTAFFRGRETGCSFDVYENPRLHISKLNYEWKNTDKKDYLNAGIISITKRSKINNGEINFQRRKYLKENNIYMADFVSHEEQQKYKYRIYIEGNSAAYRLGEMLLSDSLVIFVKSKFKLWIEQFLEPNKHYIEVEHDLSDLEEKIRWCRNNDNKCKKIVDNVNKLMRKLMSREFIYDYMQSVICSIGEKQFKQQNIYKSFENYKDNRKIIEKTKLLITNKDISKDIKTAIIVPYRNRSEHKKQFINFWKNKNIKNIKVFIIKQSNDNRKFNRGYLLNVGCHIAINQGYTNLIFHDIDLLPNDDLIPYYLYNSDKPIHIANVWKSKYTHFTYFGGVNVFNKELFIRINGFPNNMWGWGKEDDLLYRRTGELVDEIYVPLKGDFDELEHEITSINKSSTMSKVVGYKILLEDNKNNGYNNINYKILVEKECYKNIIQYTIKLY